MNHPLAIAGLLLSCVFICPSNGYGETAPCACDNPVEIKSLIVTNSSCGDSSGVIIVNLANGNNGYSFQWTPNVSNDNVAVGLKAGAYQILITDLTNPDCTLDTTVIVKNSNSPTVNLLGIQPAHCLAADGSVSLSPAGFNYSWSNGESGAVNDMLPGGCYIVTATDPGDGCYAVLQVCVPVVNPLQTTYEIQEPAKCGLPTGKALIKVSGGSGDYGYSFGNTPLAENLAPGLHTFYVVDNVSGCLDTVFVIMSEGPLQGDVLINAKNIKCPGGAFGNVEFDVEPGNNFSMPFTFTLVDANGTSQQPGNLTAGTYYLQITDADGCKLPVDTFDISEPPAFNAKLDLKNGTCADGGAIQMELSGGNGRYIIDWHDIPGYDNPQNRQHLNAGYYFATVYDSLFCAYPVDSVLIASYCNIPDTLVLQVAVNTTDTICLEAPPGVDPAFVSFAQVGAGSSVYGNWTPDNSGCLAYTAGPVPAYGVDPICMAIKTGVPGLDDTVCVVVQITAVTPQSDTIYFAVQEGESATACGNVPANFANAVVTLPGMTGLSGASDAFGTYTVDPKSACLTFQAGDETGYNIDLICVSVYDTVLRLGRIICYVPTVLSLNDCLDGIYLPDSLTLTASDCDAGAEACLPIPFSQIPEYVTLDNGAPFAGNSFAACNPVVVQSYTALLNSGPYQLNEWTVGVQVVSGFFSSAYELLGLMNQYDPVPGWSLERDSVFVGGDPAQSYGPLKIVSALGQTLEVLPGQANISAGTRVRFETGLHHLVFRRAQTGCLDTMVVKVVCTGCPPIHNYVPDTQGNIIWSLSTCLGDTTFCTNIASQDLDDYSVFDFGQPFAGFSACGNTIGLRLDTGYHVLRIQNNITFCEYTVPFTLNCSTPGDQSLIAVPDEAATPKNTSIEIDLTANDIIRGIVGNRMALADFEIPDYPNFGQLVYDDIFGMVTYTPEHDFCGIDTFTYRITDTAGLRSSALVKITVLCDKVLIYNALSPNRDGKNDVWHIPGIEQFPDNEVRIFNRWGNQVFEQKGYTNQNPWDGTWDGHHLPDGAYYYILDLGDGSAPLSGYLQIQR
ncbi:MAG: gliding motility-associated C-terminal domain-containing protein [Saprospiraceae bacterium]|nr:gliding motility-associated C-terminal domain-containing protein [Saprospiraceae bacterium]